jgi:hypothetical protein
MAAGAALLKGRSVGVPVAIAAGAETKTLPLFLFVAFGAVHLSMGPLQGEGALIMVKNELPERGLQAVALIANHSQPTFMNILVAGGAPGVFE